MTGSSFGSRLLPSLWRKPKEILRDTKIKKSEYAFAGVQEYYILDPNHVHMHFYELSATGEYVKIQPDAAGVLHSNVLPGFQFRMFDLQRLPELEDLALDEVYQGDVLLRYRSAVARAENAEQRAKAERRHAKQARKYAKVTKERMQQEQQRSERYAAMLRDLGVNLEEK